MKLDLTSLQEACVTLPDVITNACDSSTGKLTQTDYRWGHTKLWIHL